MKYNSLIIGLSVLALQSCTDNFIYTEPGNEVILTGNTYKAVFTESSSTDPTSSLNSGSRILLNASGSLQINNEVLTYIDNQWKAENEFDWTDIAGNTTITALYPVYSDVAYTKENLYRNEALEDILYVNDEFPAGNKINLQFKHLFSLLTLHMDEKLQTDFQKIEVTCPVVVSAIEATSAQVMLATNEAHTSSITQISSSGNYLFIVPPAENVTISIDMHTNGKKYSTQLQSKSFIGNQEYIYNLKTSEKTPGIVTAEDWIAFSQLINHKNITEYNGKTLNDFGEMIDGVMTYRLLNNIDFEGVDCSKLEHVGVNTKKMFEAIFDGQGYTIFNLTPKSSDGTTGLFGCIASCSTIKNLHIKKCSITLSKNSGSSSGIGTLAGVSYGTIANCSVEDGEFNSTTQNTPTGGLVGDLRGGTIINCYIQNAQITGKLSTGGVVGNSYGTILNCFSASNSVTSEGGNSGGISGKSDFNNPTTINNCYVYNLKVKKAKGGLFYGIITTNNSTISHCFYNRNYATYADLLIGSGSNNQNTNNYKFQSDFTYNSIPVYQLLNQWIDETAPTLYPDYAFTRWKDGGESLPAVFVTETQRD